MQNVKTPDSTAWQSVSQQIDLAAPVKQRAFHVTSTQWARVKKCIRAIKPEGESYWLVSAVTSISVGASWLAGAIGLDSAQGVDGTVLTIVYSVSAAFGAAFALSVIGFLESKGHRESGINTAIEAMEDIEAGFPDASA